MKFLKYSIPLPEMAENVRMDAFVIGLEAKLHAEVVSHHPRTLEECMRGAQLVKDRNITLKLAITKEEPMALIRSPNQ